MYFCIFVYFGIYFGEWHHFVPRCFTGLRMFVYLYVNILMALWTDLYIYEYTFWDLCDVYMCFLMC
jgi:hypothetical protein